MMNCLEYFIDQAWEELHYSKEYTLKAIDHKPAHRRWADILFQTAAQEYTHYEAFRDMANEVVAKAKESNHEDAHYIEQRWMREHEKLALKAIKVKMLHDAYRNE